MMLISVLFFLFYHSSLSFGFRRSSPVSQGTPVNEDVYEPLFLSPFIEAGKIGEGRSAAEVRLPGNNLTSYAGFFTVNKSFNSNLFFWFFPAEIDPESAPVVLWLQGGPGSSSLFGLFCEHGPLTPDANGKMRYNNYSWAKAFNMIYIDSPVGAGFSFTEDKQGFARNQADVGVNLHQALLQFFQLFPSLRGNDFYVTGESYAGKYVPAVSYTIHIMNEFSPKINLKGLAIGNGCTDPENMMNYGDYLYQLGLIDKNALEVFHAEEEKTRTFIRQGNYKKATETMDPLIFKMYTPYNSYFNNMTGLKAYYNYLTTEDATGPCESAYKKYILSTEVRKSIHVGNLTYQNGHETAAHLFQDISKSVKPWVEELLENYRVLFYNGQLDIICAYPLSLSFFQKLSWSGTETYKYAPRKQLMVDGELAGYTKSAKNFTEILVRNAGHMVPFDQPKWAVDMITRFVFHKSF